MKARPIIARARRRAAFRIGLRAFATAYNEHIAPVVAAAIEASKPLPRFTTGGIKSLPEQGGEYVINRTRHFTQLLELGSENAQAARVPSELDITELRASLLALAERTGNK